MNYNVIVIRGGQKLVGQIDPVQFQFVVLCRLVQFLFYLKNLETCSVFGSNKFSTETDQTD